jgi:hypothetical protein
MCGKILPLLMSRSRSKSRPLRTLRDAFSRRETRSCHDGPDCDALCATCTASLHPPQFDADHPGFGALGLAADASIASEMPRVITRQLTDHAVVAIFHLALDQFIVARKANPCSQLFSKDR